jgi:hypothetical protein
MWLPSARGRYCCRHRARTLLQPVSAAGLAVLPGLAGHAAGAGRAAGAALTALAGLTAGSRRPACAAGPTVPAVPAGSTVAARATRAAFAAGATFTTDATRAALTTGSTATVGAGRAVTAVAVISRGRGFRAAVDWMNDGVGVCGSRTGQRGHCGSQKRADAYTQRHHIIGVFLGVAWAAMPR